MIEKIDHIPKGYKKFYLRAANKVYLARERSCLFCKYCDDIIWDYTNGPYLVSCEKYKDIETGLKGKCKYFRKGADYV